MMDRKGTMPPEIKVRHKPGSDRARYRHQVQQKLQRVRDSGIHASSIGRAIGVSRQSMLAFSQRGVLRLDKVRALDSYLNEFDTNPHPDNQVQEFDISCTTKAHGSRCFSAPMNKIREILKTVSSTLEQGTVTSLNPLDVKYVRDNMEYILNVLIPAAHDECMQYSNVAQEPVPNQSNPRKARPKRVRRRNSRTGNLANKTE